MSLSQWYGRLLGLDTRKPARRPVRRPRSRRSSLPPVLEYLEDRLAPATTITILAAASGGSLDGILTANNGVILATDGGNIAGSLSAGALAALPGTDNISITAQNSIVFNDLTAFNAGTLSMLATSGHSATFNANSGSITFNNTLNTLATAGGDLDLIAGANLTLANLNSGGGNVLLTAGTAGAGNVAFGNILTGGVGNITLQATNASGGAITQNAGSGVGLAINATATGNITVNSLQGTAVNLTSNIGSVSSAGASAVQAGTQLTLSAAAGITLNTSAAGLQATNSTSGNISITQLASPVQALTINGTGVVNNASTGTISITNLGAAITVNNASTVQSSNGAITLAATDLQLNGTVSSGTARTTLTSVGGPIDLGTNTAGTVGLTQSEVNEITAGVLQIGGNVAGNINISAAITSPASWNTLTLVNGGTISEAAAGALNVPNLRVSSSGPVTLGSVNNVGSLGASTTGAFLINNGATLTIPSGGVDGVQGITTSGGNVIVDVVTVGGSLTASGPISTSGGVVDLTAAADLTAGDLNSGGGAVQLTAGTGGAGNVSFGNILTGGAGNITIQATNASGGTISQIAGSAVGLAITATATGNATVNSLRGTTVNLTSNTGSVDSAGASAVQAGTQLTLSAAAGITLNTSAAGLQAINSTAGNIGITQLASPAQALTITGTGVVNNAATGTINITNLGAAITVNNGSPVQSNNGNITLAATDLQLNGVVNSGTARTTLTSIGGPIDLGTNTPGTVGLTQNEVNEVTAGVLQIGGNVVGNINISAAITSPASWNTLTLVNGGTISEAAAGALNVPNLRVSSSSPVTLGNANNVGSLGASTTGAFLINNGANTLTIPGAGVDGVQGVTTNNSNITLSADAMAVGQAVNAGTGTITLAPVTPGRPITLGATVANTLSLLQSNLNEVTAALLVIGSAPSTGNISVAGPITSVGTGWTNLSLSTGGAIVEQNTGQITANQLALSAATGIGSTTALPTNVSSLAFQNSASGAVQITNSQALTIASFAGLATSKNSGGPATLIVTQGSLTFGVGVTTSGDLNASTTGATTPDITVNGGVTLDSTAGNVILTAARGIDEIAGATLKSDTQAVCLNYNNNTGTLTLNGSVKGTAGAAKGAPVLANNKTLPVASVTFTTQPGNSLASPAVMSKVVVTCFDRFGNIVPGATVSLKLQTGTTLTGTTSVATNAQGQAVFTNLSVGLAGTYSFLASVVNTSGFTPLGVYEPVIAPQAVTQASTKFTIGANAATTQLRKR